MKSLLARWEIRWDAMEPERQYFWARQLITLTCLAAATPVIIGLAIAWRMTH